MKTLEPTRVSNRQRDSQVYDVAFIPGVGHLNYRCGSSESIYQIVRNMHRRTLVITEGPYGLTERLRKEGRPVIELPSPIPLMRGFRRASLIHKLRFVWLWVSYACRLAWLLRRNRIGVVYTANSASILCALPVKLAGLRLITALRGGVDNSRKWKWVYRVSDRVCVLSHEMKEALLAAIASGRESKYEEKTVVIYNGVDLQEIPPADDAAVPIRDELGLDVGDLVVLYVAAFRAAKGQLDFINRVVPSLLRDAVDVDLSCSYIGGDSHLAPPPNRPPLAHVVFLGGSTNERDQEYEAKCRLAAAESPHKGQLHFCGYREDVWPWYALADIVVLGSESEGMARCFIESMAMGKPVVCYDVCSARELLEANRAGVVVRQRDPAALSAAVKRLMDAPHIRRQLGENGRAFVKDQLDIRQIGGRHDQLVDELRQRRGNTFRE